MDSSKALTESQNRFNDLMHQYGRTYDEFSEEVKRMPREYFNDGQFSISRSASKDKISRDDFIKRMTLFLYDLKAHPCTDSVIFIRKHGGKRYRSCTIKELTKYIASIWNMVFNCTPVNEIDTCAKNVMRSVTENADIRNRVFSICENLYFVPGDENNLKETPDETTGCYYTLDGPDKLLGVEKSHLVKEYYDKFNEELYREDRRGKQFYEFYRDLPMDFEWIRMWANEPEDGWRDRYWDILISHSTPFFKKLIDKIYWYDGPRRSGKSTSNMVIRFTFGDNNAAKVALNEYADEHFNHKLLYCCVNAPDEEKKGTLSPEGCQIFKSLSAKIPKELKVMRDNNPVTADGQFMSFHPTNSNIGWPDGESGPCLYRCIIIFFHNDLSKYDNNGKDFIEETFKKNPEEYAKYLGTIFALAGYFSREDKNFFLSPQVALANEYISVDTDTLGIYYDEFYKYFNGVCNADFLFEDYQYACREYGWEQQSKSAFRQKFVALLTSKRNPVKLKCKPAKTIRAHKLITKNSHADILCPDFDIAEFDSQTFRNAGILHDNKISVVACLKNAREAELEKIAEEKSNRQQELVDVLGKKEAKKILGDDYKENLVNG